MMLLLVNYLPTQSFQFSFIYVDTTHRIPLYSKSSLPHDLQFHVYYYSKASFSSSSSLHTMLLCLKKAFTKTSIDSVDQFIQFNKLLAEILTENAEAVTRK